MAEDTVFKIGGIFFIISGAMLLFFWLVSVAGGFETSPIPAFSMFSQVAGVELIKLILIIFGTLMGCLGIILAGLVFFKIPRVVEFVQRTDVEKKVNNLQIITWRILQYIKRKNQERR
jgi:uncharacterized membrane protein YgaE (UPF0421/DUF939 family)